MWVALTFKFLQPSRAFKLEQMGKKKVKRGEALLKFNPEESVFSNYSNLANCISIVCVFFCARCCCLLNALKLASEGD